MEDDRRKVFDSFMMLSTIHDDDLSSALVWFAQDRMKR